MTAEDDDDAGPNSDITFSITEGIAALKFIVHQHCDSLSLSPVQGVALSDSPFAIGGTSGEITTTASLDYESRSSYTIIIRAEDNGIPQKLVKAMSNSCDVDSLSLFLSLDLLFLLLLPLPLSQLELF